MSMPPPPPGGQPPPPPGQHASFQPPPAGYNPSPTVPFEPLPPLSPGAANTAAGSGDGERKRRVALFAGLGALVLAAGAVGAFFATRSDSDGPAAIDAPSLLPQVTKMLDTVVALPRGETAACPFGDIDDFAARAPASLQAVAKARLPELSNTIAEDGRRMMVCGARSDDGAEMVAVFAGTPVGSDPVTAMISPEKRDVTAGVTRQARGGTVGTACGRLKDDSKDVLCNSVWFANGMQVGVVARGGAEVTEASTEQWLDAVLDDLVAGLRGIDVTKIRPPSATS